MKIGITGSRHGVRLKQLELAIDFITGNATEIHHGSCVGVDELIHKEFVKTGNKIVIHPPTKPFYRFYPKPYDNLVVLPEKEYLQRNREIVQSCECLVALPLKTYTQDRSGTWTTMRYAEQAGIPIFCFYPDGGFIEWSSKFQREMDKRK